jgi:uncharacterized protein YcfJ
VFDERVSIMKTRSLLTVGLCLAASGWAQAQTTVGAPVPLAAPVELGQVISSTPVMQQFPVQRQMCNDEEVLVQQPKTGAGAAIGAVAGGVIGSAVGHGSGASTVIGAIGGAIIGDNAEQPNTSAQNVRRCTTQTSYENRVVGYNVVYSYAGKQYAAQLPYDPGQTIQLHVGPAVQAAAPTPAVTETTTVYAPAPATNTTVIVSPGYGYYPPQRYYYTWPYVVVPGPGPRHGGPWFRHP